MKPSWAEYYLEIAKTVSIRSSCTRSKVGAVIVRGTRASFGYNDSPAGMPGCEACPRRCKTEAEALHNDYSDCVAIHAELNAILHTDRADREGATIYITRPPCQNCLKAIRGSGIARYVTPENPEGVELWAP